MSRLERLELIGPWFWSKEQKKFVEWKTLKRRKKKMFAEGEVCSKKVWVVMDYTDKVVWIYHVDGSTMLLCLF